MAAPADMDHLRAAWRALAGGCEEADGWKTIPVATGAACALLAGRRLPGGEEALLVGFRTVRTILDSHLPQGHGFEVSRLATDPIGSERRWVALARRTNGSLDLFCDDGGGCFACSKPARLATRTISSTVFFRASALGRTSWIGTERACSLPRGGAWSLRRTRRHRPHD